MRLDLNDDLFIKSDSVCFMLCRKTVVQERDPKKGGRGKAPKPENVGQEREKVMGYYGSIRQALQAAVEKQGLVIAETTGIADLELHLAVLLEAIERVPNELAQRLRDLETELATLKGQLEKEEE